MGQWFESIRKRLKINDMYFLQNFFIWIRKNLIRVLFREYEVSDLFKLIIIELPSTNIDLFFSKSSENIKISKTLERSENFTIA